MAPRIVGLIAGLLLAAPALAQERLELWLPQPEGTLVWAAGPFEATVVRWRGDRLAPIGDVELTAKAGVIERAPSDDPYFAPFIYVPPPLTSAEEILTVRSGALSAEVKLKIDPSSVGRVVVEVEASSIVKRRGTRGETALTLRTFGPDGKLAGDVAPRLFTNTGEVSAPEQTGPGVFRATYRVSEAAYPEVAVVAALLPWPHEASAAVAVGQAVIKQPAAIELPGETKPGVEMRVQIAGETFGPVQADDVGRFRVPVVVPPGVGMARGVSVDRYGNKRTRNINLQLPPTQRLALAAHPRTLVADGHGRALIAVTALEADGEPYDGRAPRLTARRGRLDSLVRTGPGTFHAWYAPPTQVGDGRDVVEARLPGDRTSLGEVHIELVPGPPTTLSAQAVPELLIGERTSQAEVSLTLRDRAGNAVRDPAVGFEVRHGAVRMKDGGDLSQDGVRLHYEPPAEDWPHEDTIRLVTRARARGDAVRLAFSAPSTLVAVDALGRPVPGAAVVAEGRTQHADDFGRVVLPTQSGVVSVQLPGSVRPTILRLAPGDDGRLHGSPASPPPLESLVRLTLTDPIPVDVQARVTAVGAQGVDVEFRVIGADGGDVFLAAPSAKAVAAGELAGTLRVSAKVGDFITVSHSPSGVAAVVLVPERVAADGAGP
jgi:hypothetical protein